MKIRWVRCGLTVLSLAACFGLAFCYAGRFDACAAITVFPVWPWFVLGIAFSALGFRLHANRMTLVAFAGWVLFLLAFAEEPWSLLRSLTLPKVGSPGEADVLRVISLNCNVGDVRAAREVADARPDIVLLQESPGRSEVESVAKSLFGEGSAFVSGVDASMIIRGRAVPADLTPGQRAFFVQARIQLESSREVEVICTRLVPAVFRLDLWSPECWREQSRNRRVRRAQLQSIAKWIESIPKEIPVILGGDFNAPQGDAVFGLLIPRLHDTFTVSGRGWGNTVINDWPFSRIDQIWVSGTVRSISVVARATRHSDHRMVVCDLTIPKK